MMFAVMLNAFICFYICIIIFIVLLFTLDAQFGDVCLRFICLYILKFNCLKVTLYSILFLGIGGLNT